MRNKRNALVIVLKAGKSQIQTQADWAVAETPLFIDDTFCVSPSERKGKAAPTALLQGSNTVQKLLTFII